MVSPSHIADATALGWKQIRGPPKSLKAARHVLDETDVQQRPEMLVRSTAHSLTYAAGKEAAVFGKSRSIAVYRNMEKGVRNAGVRNDALKSIGA